VSIACGSWIAYVHTQPLSNFDQSDQVKHLDAAARFAEALAGVDLDLKLSRNQCEWQKEIKLANTWFDREQAVPKLVERVAEQSTDKERFYKSEQYKKLFLENQLECQKLRTEIFDFIGRCGWPRSEEYGPRTGQTIALFVQHDSVETQKKFLRVMVEAAKGGDLKPRACCWIKCE
jgi:hypothetical protein